MYVHRSNRVEVLVEALARVVARPLTSPLMREVIVVQSRGMERWLSIQLAARLGVWAGASFPFPRSFLDSVLCQVLETAGDADPFDRERLRWWIARLLPELAHEPTFAPIARYLTGDAGGHKLLELAARIANTFDDYAVYRPEMVLRWEAGDTTLGEPSSEEAWQARLWQRLVELLGAEHTAARAQRFLAQWSELAALPPGLPERVSVFGISSLPPIYLELLDVLSQRIEVHLFSLSPSREHVSEIRSQREILRELRRSAVIGSVAPDPESLLLAEGNPLLATFGRVERDFQRVLESVSNYVPVEDDPYVNPGQDSALHVLQSDVLLLRHRGAGREAEPQVLAADDHSLSVHACHSPSREVEVLRDQLRARFEADPSLSPEDVVVMAPDVELYAPLIEATFGGGQGDSLAIPYSIADRSHRAASSVAQAFLAVLAVLRGRFGASAVADLLHHRPVLDRFGMGVEEVPLLRRWIGEAGIRWGVDAADRAAHGQPPSEANTWRFGLHRLLLGYAMPGGDRELFGGTLPYDDVEGSSAEALGRLAELCERLFEFHSAFRGEYQVGEWVSLLERVLSTTLAVDASLEWEVQAVREALRQLGRHALESGFERALPSEVIASLVERALEAHLSARQFLTGGVTFCALLPMRSIPFRVVAVLGMNDGQFPRLQRRLGFDLIAARPRPGDRSVRDEDRYLFLEALLSARDQLIVTYVGRSVHDNSVLPPAVVLGELLDVLTESFVAATDTSPQRTLDFGPAPPGVRAQVFAEHPLQPFSPRYFTDRSATLEERDQSPHLFSFDSLAAEGAAQLVSEPSDPPRFVQEPLPELDLEEAPVGISLEELAAFLENPARALLRGRLGLHLEERPAVLDDHDPITLDPLERWRLGTSLLELTLAEARSGQPLLRGESLEAVWAAVRARGVLPVGVSGRCWFDDLVPDVRVLAEMTHRWAAGERLPPAEVVIDCGDARVQGQLRNLWPGAQIRAGFSRIQPRHELRAWVEHLALQCVEAPDDLPRTTLVVGRDPGGDGAQRVAFASLPESRARSLLAELVRLYRLGMQVPLPFFSAASRRYVTVRTQRLDRDPGEVAAAEQGALKNARELYLPADFNRQRGESEDPYVALVFGGWDPIGVDPDAPYEPFAVPLPEALSVPSFPQLARLVFEPLLAAFVEEEA